VGLLNLFGGGAKDRFAQMLMKRFRDRNCPWKLTYDPKAFTIDAGAEGGTIYLANYFRDWHAYPASQRDAALDQIVSIHLNYKDQPVDWQSARASVLPALRNFEALAELGHSNGISMRPFAGDVGQLFVLDGPSTMALVTDSVFRDWRMDFDEVLAIALDNLRRLGEPQFQREESGYFIARYGDYHDASRVLLPEHLASLDLQGDPVALILSRMDLVVMGAEDREALNAAGEVIADAWPTITRPVSFIPYVCRGGVWSSFEGGDHAGAMNALVEAGRRLLS
jgi:uncharacterized protein YtpQ (UPF0354 family)